MARGSFPTRDFLPGRDDVGRRLDRVVRRLLPSAPLSRIFQAIRTGEIQVGGRVAAGAYRVREGDVIRVRAELAEESAVQAIRPPTDAPPDWLLSAILLENEHLLVLNKPRGLLVHGEGSVEQAVRAYLAPRLPASLSFVPGPLHRLDRNTSGLLAFGKSLSGARLFSELLRQGAIGKLYLGLLEGALAERAEWEDTLIRTSRDASTRQSAGGANARTTAVPLLRGGRLTLAAIQIATGFTHQIRAQAQIHGYPLAGDRKYGGSPRPGGYLLHAWILELPAHNDLLGFTRIVAAPPPRTVALLRDELGEGPVDALLAGAGQFPLPFSR